MNDLTKLLEEWRLARLKYPNVRREIEDRLFGAIVARTDLFGPEVVGSIKALADSVTDIKARVAEMEAEMQRRKGGRPKAGEPEKVLVLGEEA